MASSAYATVTDLRDYLPSAAAQAQNQTALTTFLNVASRFLDTVCGQYFYSEQISNVQSAFFFDSEGMAHVDTGQHPFFAKIGTIGALSAGATSMTFTPYQGPAPAQGDQFIIDFASTQEVVTVNGAVTGSSPGPFTCPITATLFAHVAGTSATTLQVKLAFFENQPLAQWVTVLSGNGIAPPSNYFLWPRNRPNAGSSADPTQRRPYYGIDIAHIPISNTTFLPSSIPGYMTVSLTSYFGWPAVPDLIKDLTCKLATRMWRSRESGWGGELGSAEAGRVNAAPHFDALDEHTLLASDLKLVHL